MTRIMAATPVASTGAVEPECVHSILHQALPDGVELTWEFERGHEVFVERNSLVRKALKGEYDAILFVDSDVKLPGDAVRNLLDPPEPAVMGFVPFKNTKTGKCSVYRPGYFFDKANCIHANDLESLPDRVEVKGGGFGCVLIDMSVFDKVEPPWFLYTESENGIRRGEDIHFCYKAEAAGVRIFADTRVLCQHKRSDWA